MPAGPYTAPPDRLPAPPRDAAGQPVGAGGGGTGWRHYQRHDPACPVCGRYGCDCDEWPEMMFTDPTGSNSALGGTTP